MRVIQRHRRLDEAALEANAIHIVPVVACEQIQENEWHLHNIWLVAPKYREMRVNNLEYLCISIKYCLLIDTSQY